MDDQNKSLTDRERWAPADPTGPRGYATDPGYTSGDAGAAGREYDSPTGTEDETSVRAREIRSEIERTREDMGETIEAIQDRLNPRNAASRAASNVRDAAMDRMRQVANTVQERMPGMNRHQRYDSGGYGLMDRVRDNPVPAALAATGIAWLAFASRRDDELYRPAMYGSTRGGQAFVQEGRIDVSDEESFGHDTGTYGTGDTRDGGRRTARSMQMLSGTGERMRRASGDVGFRARRMASSSPLAAAGVAAVMGLAIGLLLPETERENELMGEKRDALIEKGRESVRDAAERVQETAKDVQRAASSAVKAVTDPNEGRGTGNTGSSPGTTGNI